MCTKPEQILISKATLRQTILSVRDTLDDRLDLPIDTLAANGQVVSAYHAMGSEIDPAPLVSSLARQGARLALPVLHDRQTMVFRAWDASKPLVPVGFGTLGPDDSQPDVRPDFVLAPLAAFSATGQRIGYGKGHYDRALSKMHAAEHFPAYVGLAFDEQEVPPFEAEPHDIPLHGVLTPSGLRVFDHGREALLPFLA
jgi:5-formyltetrahydrofolate cyclo-ligase